MTIIKTWVTPMPALNRFAAASLVSVIAGRMRNQLTAIRITQPTRESTIHVWDISKLSFDVPTRPMPNTHTRTSAGRLSDMCNLASRAVSPARRSDGYTSSGPNAAMTARMCSTPRIW